MRRGAFNSTQSDTKRIKAWVMGNIGMEAFLRMTIMVAFDDP
jgi:hypothetical protein